jgi:ribosomal protein S18 acetylase RimI-like enzyme
MRKFVYKVGFVPDSESVETLYKDVNWTKYTDNMTELVQALENSLFLETVWHKDKLIGLVRVIGDGRSIIYIQDILVLREYQRKGIGRKLISDVCSEFEGVRQKVLLTDNTIKIREFYEAMGFNDCSSMNLLCFVKFS